MSRFMIIISGLEFSRKENQNKVKMAECFGERLRLTDLIRDISELEFVKKD